MTPREKTIAICVGAVIGLYGLDSVLLQPYFDRLGKADDLIADHQTALNDAETVLQTRIRAGRHWRDLSADRIRPDYSSAESQLLSRVQECAGRAGLSISTLKSEKGDKEKGYERVSVKPTAVGTMQQIGRFLYELQTTDIPVRVGDLTVNSRKDGLDDLALSLTLSTIYQPSAGPRVAMSAAATGAYR